MTTVLTNIRPLGGRDSAFHATIHDGRFAQVGVAQASDTVIDGNDRMAISGFVNAHTHLPMVLLRGLAEDLPLASWLETIVWPIERRMSKQDVYWCSLLAIAESIRAGTTCVSDMYFFTSEIARAVEESGVRAVLSYGILAESMEKGGREELAQTADILAAWHGAAGGRIRVAVAPHSVYTVGQDVWEHAIQLAADHDALIHTHLCETRREVEEWKKTTGETPVAYLERIGAFSVPLVAAHCVHVDSSDIEILATHDVRVAHCPKSNAKLGSGVAPVPEMLGAGIRVALGTDGAASNNRLDIMEEARFACFVQRAVAEDPALLPAGQALRLALDNGRLALDLPDAQLADGSVADVVLLDTTAAHTVPSDDPEATLLYASVATDVTDVVVDGRVLMKDRQLLTIDEQEVKHEVQSLRRRITE